jgi:hypothetical protein
MAFLRSPNKTFISFLSRFSFFGRMNPSWLGLFYKFALPPARPHVIVIGEVEAAVPAFDIKTVPEGLEVGAAAWACITPRSSKGLALLSGG